MAMFEKAWPLLTALAGLLVGVFLGTSIQPRGPEGPPGECADRAPRQPTRITLDDEHIEVLAREVARATGRLTLDVQERKAIADEVARALRGDVKGSDAAKTAPPSPLPPSPVATHAKEEADLLLERAQSTREWTDRDAQALRLWLPMLSPGDRTAIIHTLGTALSDGRVALKSQGSAF